MIDSLSDRFSTAWLCRQLGVARSGFYDWRQRQHNPGPRAQENAAITAQIQTVFHRHRGFYGAPRVHQELRAAGLQVGRHRVARLMRRAVLKAQTRRGFKPCRNSSGRAAGVAENLLQQDFSPPAPSICTAAVWPALRAALMAVLSGEVVVLTVSYSAGRAESSSMATDWERREVRLWWGKQKRVAAGCRRVRM